MKDITEKLKAFWGKLRERAGKIARRTWIIAGAVLVVAAAVITILLNNRPYATLVTNMSADEMSSVITLLSGWGVTDYKVENNDTVLVPKDRQAELQARVLMENVTQSGLYYSTYFDHISALSTEAERNNAFFMDLQDRMRATIRCFANVKDAVVTITQGQDRSYILDSGNIVSAKATVLVTMDSGTKLTTQQASAIRTLVSNAVQGLEVDNVSISDTIGNQYSTASDYADGDASALKLQLEEEKANAVRTQVMRALTPYFGEDNVDVAVNCVVSLGNITEERTEYWGPDWLMDGSTNGRGLIGEILWQYSWAQNEDGTTGGVVGNETNADTPNPNLPNYVEDLPGPDGTEREFSTSGQKDFDNNESRKHIVTTAAQLTDCSIAVSLNSTVAGDIDVDEWRTHVARAAGIVGAVDEETGREILSDKISVVSYPFYRPVVPAPPSPDDLFLGVRLWVWIAAGAGLLLFLILLIVLLVLRSRKKRRQREAEEMEERDIDALLAAAGLGQGAPAGADIMDLQTERSMELRQDIRQFAQDNPEICAQMVRTWLKGGDENG